MYSVKSLYRIGHGPSSSHSMGPGFICEKMKERYPEATAFRVTLQGSLAKTGRGHQTEYAIAESLAPVPMTVRYDIETKDIPHPNTMIVEVLSGDAVIARQTWMSIGGGAIRELGTEEPTDGPTVYPHSTLAEIAAYCGGKGLRFSDYVFEQEGLDFRAFLETVWARMRATVEKGLCQSGHLPGGLNVLRKAPYLLDAAEKASSPAEKERYYLAAYAYAAAEENAAGGLMVTAPTCGASGVLPAVLYYQEEQNGVGREQILRALATAGLIGNIIKTCASISGAECGCQAEIGSACSMAAAGLGEIRGLNLKQIDCAAEIAMEHNLGLTCDPVGGLVQIPCIERNAMAALRACESVALAEYVYHEQKVSFDVVIRTMKETGADLSSHYRETAEGGLAKHYFKDFD